MALEEQHLRKIHKETLLQINEVKSLSVFSEGNTRDFFEHFIHKIIVLFQDIWDESSSLQSSVYSLRYILEALVKTERFIKEPDFLSLFYHQYLTDHHKRLKLLKERLVKDIEILDTYIEKKDNIDKKYSLYSKKMDSESFNKACEDRDSEVKMLYVNMSNEFSVYLESAEIETMEYLKLKLESTNYVSLSERIKEVSEEIEKKIIKDTTGNKFIRTSDEFKKYGLKEEYDFVYSFTSDLLHCRSYSIHTSSELDKNETNMFKILSSKFVRRIADNLKKIGEFPDLIYIEVE